MDAMENNGIVDPPQQERSDSVGSEGSEGSQGSLGLSNLAVSASCWSCNEVLDEDQAYCHECGASQQEDQKHDSGPPGMEEEDPSEEPEEPEDPEEPEEPEGLSDDDEDGLSVNDLLGFDVYGLQSAKSKHVSLDTNQNTKQVIQTKFPSTEFSKKAITERHTTKLRLPGQIKRAERRIAEWKRSLAFLTALSDADNAWITLDDEERRVKRMFGWGALTVDGHQWRQERFEMHRGRKRHRSQ